MKSSEKQEQRSRKREKKHENKSREEKNKGLLKVRIERIVKKNWQRLEICAFDESERGG